ncbi:MAG: Uma2 family endonuclease [Fibrella sp.]|nr:Uma2 family endonuclease [Armatimonadota bacterium]
MVTTTPERSAGIVVLNNVSWETYESLLKDHESSSTPRFTYDEGTLTIMSPLRFHESTNRVVAYMVDIILDEWRLDCDNIGSLTLKSPGQKKGLEPDTCFYIENVGALDDKDTPDLEQGDPAPDLVIEIDDTSLSAAKMPIYAAFGVPEVWRIRKISVEILLLQEGEYVTAPESKSLPKLTPATIIALLAQSENLTRFAWADAVREWAKANRFATP